MKSTYRHHEAGFHAVTTVPVALVSASVGDALALLQREAGSFTTLNYVYITNSDGVLEGVVSLRELYQSNPAVLLSEFCGRKLIVARPHTDQERVARLALHHSLKAVPVVSAAHVFIGAVPSDTILSILDAEHHEDVLRTSGISVRSGRYTLATLSIRESVFVRLPWLIVGVSGGAVAAAVVAHFEESIAAVVLLAAFIPAVVYLADAVGSQIQSVLIRALAVTPDMSYVLYLRKEIIVTLGVALVLTGVVASATWVVLGDSMLVLILGLTATVTILVTALISVTLPFIFKHFGSDPAIASGPLATVVRDVSSLLIYFAIAGAII
jgi:magnesium transporter